MKDDVLIVTKMDRLGRDAIDVKSTIDKLTGMGVRIHCLQLGGADLTSAAGRICDNKQKSDSFADAPAQKGCSLLSSMRTWSQPQRYAPPRRSLDPSLPSPQHPDAAHSPRLTKVCEGQGISLATDGAHRHLLSMYVVSEADAVAIGCLRDRRGAICCRRAAQTLPRHHGQRCGPRWRSQKS
jgi:hypothetical protein